MRKTHNFMWSVLALLALALPAHAFYTIDDYIRDIQQEGMQRAGLKAVAGLANGSSPSFTNVTATGQFLAPDGTVGAPGYAFTSQPNTGFYIASGLVNFGFGGIGFMRLSNSAIGPIAAGGYDLGNGSLGWKRLYIDFTNTGTVGAVTINKAAGRVNIAAAGTSIVVTDSLVTAASEVFAIASTNDATCAVKNVVPAAGSFTLTTTAACTAQTSFSFFVVNTD